MELSNNWENFAIYYSNLSYFYLCSCLFTLIALFSTWWLRSKEKIDYCGSLLGKNKDVPLLVPWKDEKCEGSNFNQMKNLMANDEEDEIHAEARRLAKESIANEHSLMRQVKSARQSVIEKQLTAGLSEEQLQKEKEMQASQLEAIYKLLKEKEEQFQIRSMDELQEQLKLYRS